MATSIVVTFYPEVKRGRKGRGKSGEIFPVKSHLGEMLVLKKYTQHVQGSDLPSPFSLCVCVCVFMYVFMSMCVPMYLYLCLCLFM